MLATLAVGFGSGQDLLSTCFVSRIIYQQPSSGLESTEDIQKLLSARLLVELLLLDSQIYTLITSAKIRVLLTLVVDFDACRDNSPTCWKFARASATQGACSAETNQQADSLARLSSTPARKLGVWVAAVELSQTSV